MARLLRALIVLSLALGASAPMAGATAAGPEHAAMAAMDSATDMDTDADDAMPKHGKPCAMPGGCDGACMSGECRTPSACDPAKAAQAHEFGPSQDAAPASAHQPGHQPMRRGHAPGVEGPPPRS